MGDLPNLSATDTTDATAAQAGASVSAQPDNGFSFELPGNAGTFSIDIAQIPAETRLALLKDAIKGKVVNRVNVAQVRHNKANEPFAKYDEAKALFDKDPITGTNPGDAPTGDRPTAPDLVKLATEARDGLYKGELRRKSDGPAKPRTPKDPVDALVTQTVRSELIAKNKATNPKYGLIDANKALAEFDGSGTAFLKSRIEAAVAAGGDQAQLDKMLETRYLAPARMMAGVGKMTGKNAELPNIL